MFTSGQGNSTTPIQLVNAVSASVNGGSLMVPYVLKYISNSTGDMLHEKQPTLKRKVISEETSALMRYALETVVANGTGRGAYVDGYRIGGKTGTAQKVGPNGTYLANNYILSFLGVAPMNNPEIAVYIAVDNPKNTIQYGGTVVAPLVGEVFSQVLPTLGIQKDLKNQINKEYRYYIDKFYYEVPYFIGQEKKSIKPSSRYNYVYIGEGNKVIDQSPNSGEKVPEGGTIIMYLN